MSELTKKYQKRTIIFKALSIIVCLTPLIVAVIGSYGSINVVNSRKIQLTGCIIIALTLWLINVLCKYKLRSPIFIILFGVGRCIGSINGLLILTSICVIVDEFILEPLYKYNKNKYTINKEIDARL